jgi:hypothetical protein
MERENIQKEKAEGLEKAPSTFAHLHPPPLFFYG